MTLLCITNQMDDWRSCTIRDQHTVRCESDTCTGCLPREARVGLLCWGCWDKVEHAFADWTPERRRALASITRAVQRDTEGRTGSGPEGYVPIPGTVLAVDEVESYLRSCGRDARLWVSTQAGAMDAVRFAAAVPRALRTHELEERQRPVRRVRCPDCGQVSLVRNPPADVRAPVTVVCQNEACARTIREGDRTTRRPDGSGDEESLAVIARIERSSRKEARA